MSTTPADDNPLPEDDPGQPLDQDIVAPGEEPDEVTNPTAGEAEQPVPPEQSLEQQLADAEQSLLRGKAELDNFRKRSQRELAEQRRYAALPLARDLLNVIDNLQRAVEAGEGEGLVHGVQMVVDQLATILGQYDCVLIEAEDQAFDPNLHEAIGQVPSEDRPAGTILQVTQPGYRMHDRVVRPSQVLVARSPEPGADDADSGPEEEEVTE
ncbi:MAG: nucleotide exchange factor GrpE [Pirellulaceae bacterium]